jgi:glycosyltransferase involved in cell wall biosynthesis
MIEPHRGDHSSPTLALLPWGNVIEDFLDTLGFSIESFCRDFTGSWMFGYVDALQRAGVRTVVICVSARVATPTRFTHDPTGATVYVLPALKSYRLLQRKMLKPSGPYGRNVTQAFGDIRGVRLLFWPALSVLKEAVLYLTTPPWLLTRILRREKCTALLCQEYEYPRFDVCVLLGRLLGLPVFATFQGGDYQRKRLERFSRPLAMRLCAGLIVASEAEAARVRARYGIPASKIARIFNPVDPEVWSPSDRDTARAKLCIPPAARVAVWHGRVSIRQKGLDTLLDAWRQVCARRPDGDLRLILIGTGTDAETLRNAITEVGLPGVLWIEQFIQDRAIVREYLAVGDVYVFPSRHEGFPVAPIEAMACGLPVAAADASGVAEILAGGEASGGVIVPREDPQALALAVGRFLDDPAWSRAMGQRARLRVTTCFAPGPVGRQLRAFLSAADPGGGPVRKEPEVLAPTRGRT